MKLLTKEIEARLLKQGAERRDDAQPVLKLFAPWGAATWLISELDPEEPRALKGPFGLTVERDLHFRADKSLVAYADEARRAGRIAA